jgi:hypothetical protein
MRWILKFLFNHHLINEFDILSIWLEGCLNEISHIISFKAVFIIKIITFNLQEFARFHILNSFNGYFNDTFGIKGDF